MPYKKGSKLAKYMPEWKKRKAKEMARNMTKPERLLWNRIKNKQLGFWVYKQVPKLGYVFDFWVACGICIEVDGPCHKQRKESDAKRDKVLQEHGIKTLRFTSKSVENNLNVVVSMIKAEVKKANG